MLVTIIMYTLLKTSTVLHMTWSETIGMMMLDQVLRYCWRDAQPPRP
jgi:hypothetical protein